MERTKDKFNAFLIDFGLCKRFIDKNGDHIPMLKNKALTVFFIK